MDERQPATRDYVLVGTAILLTVLAAATTGGLLWSLIADQDFGGVVLTPIVVVAYVFLGVAAWRPTVWSRNPKTGEVPRRDRGRDLSHREVIMSRAMLIGTPTITVLGAVPGWWPWSFPAMIALTFAGQLFLFPRNQRRQILCDTVRSGYPAHGQQTDP